MNIFTDQRVGKMITPPVPRCKWCGEFLEIINEGMADEKCWYCDKCKAEFEYLDD